MLLSIVFLAFKYTISLQFFTAQATQNLGRGDNVNVLHLRLQKPGTSECLQSPSLRFRNRWTGLLHQSQEGQLKICLWLRPTKIIWSSTGFQNLKKGLIRPRKHWAGDDGHSVPFQVWATLQDYHRQDHPRQGRCWPPVMVVRKWRHIIFNQNKSCLIF